MYFWVNSLVLWHDFGGYIFSLRNCFLVVGLPCLHCVYELVSGPHYVHLSPILDQSAWGKMSTWPAGVKNFPAFFFLATLHVPFRAK